MIVKEVRRADLVEEVENTNFNFKMPEQLEKLKPTMMVEVSKNRVVMVYGFIGPDRYGNNQGKQHYATVCVNKKTGAEVSGGRHDFEHLWELKHWLVSYSVQLNIKKRRRTEVEELNDED